MILHNLKKGTLSEPGKEMFPLLASPNQLKH